MPAGEGLSRRTWIPRTPPKRCASCDAQQRTSSRRHPRPTGRRQRPAFDSPYRATSRPAYSARLRKFDPPYIYPARAESIREIENRIFQSSYKGVHRSDHQVALAATGSGCRSRAGTC